jgi:3-deoxy-D-manno-octulosonic-acid transferase
MRLIYNIGIRIYWLAAWIISPWNRKAKLWIQGRKRWLERLQQAFNPGDRVIWVHCASMGEFEQGRPVIEAIREQCPDLKILLTFFSPSGYEKRKDYPLADHVMYLPLDTARNARKLVNSLHLEMALFIKYEFWFHFLTRLKKSRVPVYLASGIFRSDQLFFKWYGYWYRNFLDAFSHIFVQEEFSQKLLEGIGVERVSVAGDTRFDRVNQLVHSAYSNHALEAFAANSTVIVAGSTWEPDEHLLEETYKELPSDVKWIIAPHELSEGHLGKLRKRFPGAALFTEIEGEVPPGVRVIIVDTIGHLSHLYRFGTMAYIGGGFGKGIHNILEAATYGLPVFFGPNYKKFSEAHELLERGAAFKVSGATDLLSTVRQQLASPDLLKSTSETASKYVSERLGASSLIAERLCIK